MQTYSMISLICRCAFKLNSEIIIIIINSNNNNNNNNTVMAENVMAEKLLRKR